jgi:hypothetical protein
LTVGDRVTPHRSHDRRTEGVAGMLDAVAHQPAVEARALVQAVALEPVVRPAERELRRENVRDRRGVQQRLGEQHRGRRRGDHGRHAGLDDLGLGDALDHDEIAAAAQMGSPPATTNTSPHLEAWSPVDGGPSTDVKRWAYDACVRRHAIVHEMIGLICSNASGGPHTAS